jgi:hypothetical protein
MFDPTEPMRGLSEAWTEAMGSLSDVLA